MRLCGDKSRLKGGFLKHMDTGMSSGMEEMQKALAVKQVEQAFAENAKIRGNLGTLSDGRLVFIGEKQENRDEWYIAFRNAEGDDTRLRLSKEAMATLVQLYKQHPKGNDTWPMQIKTAWQVT